MKQLVLSAISVALLAVPASACNQLRVQSFVSHPVAVQQFVVPQVQHFAVQRVVQPVVTERVVQRQRRPIFQRRSRVVTRSVVVH